MPNEKKEIVEVKSALEVAKTKIAALARELKVTPEYLQTIMNTVAKGAPIEVFMMLMRIAKNTGLDPLQKEVWCYSMGGNWLTVTSRDGFLSIANRNPRYKGMNSGAVYEKDEFSVEYGENAIIKHKITTLDKKARGQILGAWAQVWKEGNTQPTTVVVEWSQYNKGRNTWNSNPDAMIIKCAESIGLKKTFGVSGLVSGEEVGYEEKASVEDTLFNTIVKTIESVKEPEKKKEIAEREIAENKALTDEQKEQLKKFI